MLLEMLLSYFWWRQFVASQICGKPTPEIRFLPGQFRTYVNAIAQWELRWFTPWPWIKSHDLLIEARRLNNWAMATPMIYSSPMPRCQAMIWCDVAEEPTKREKEIKPWLFIVISYSAFLPHYLTGFRTPSHLIVSHKHFLLTMCLHGSLNCNVRYILNNNFRCCVKSIHFRVKLVAVSITILVINDENLLA